MDDNPYVLKVVFYLSETGNEPVREWLKELKTSGRSVKRSRPLS